MKCKQVQELIGAYVYGDLPPDEMRAVRLHAQECSECMEDIRTRSAVVSSIANAAPELSEEDRQRIAWSVKGAVRAERGERRGLRLVFGPATAYVLAAAVVIGLAVVKVTVSRSPAPVARQAGISRAVVTVTEEPASRAEKNASVARETGEAGGTVNQPETSATDAPRAGQRRQRGHVDLAGAAYYLRQGTGPAAAGRPSRGAVETERAIIPDEPAPIASNSADSDLKENAGGTKLPKPTGLNDVQTVPEKPVDDEAQPEE